MKFKFNLDVRFCKSYHPFVVLFVNRDLRVFSDDVCDLMKIREERPAVVFGWMFRDVVLDTSVPL